MLIPSLALAAVVLLLVGGFWGYSAYADRKYLAALKAEIAKIPAEGGARIAGWTANSIMCEAQVRLLDRYRGQTHADLDALNEVTRLLTPPIWTTDLDLSRDTVRMMGEAPQAAGLIKILDSSPYFENSVPDSENAKAGRRGRNVPDSRIAEEALMQTGSLDRRSLFALAGGVAVILIVRFVFFADGTPAAIAATDTIPAAERRLEKVRQIAATVPGKEELLKQAKAELAEREKGVLRADTEAQAQAQLLELVQAIAQANGIDARGMQELRGKPIGDDYGEIWTTVAVRVQHRTTGQFPDRAGKPAADSGHLRYSRERRPR